MFNEGFPSEKKKEIKVSLSVSFEQKGETTLLGSKIQNKWQTMSTNLFRNILLSLQVLSDNVQGAASKNTRIRKLQVQKF